MKMLALVLGLAVAAWAAYAALNQTARGSFGVVEEPPAKSLENVREAAKRTEADAFRRAAESGKPVETSP